LREIGDFNIRRRTGLCLVTLWVFVVGLILINPFVFADSDIPFTPETPFNIPNCNGWIYFSVNGVYSSAILENNSWIFSNLHLSNSHNLKSFTASAKDCNITIISFEVFSSYENSGMLRYNVTGLGTQAFNLGLSPSFGLSSKFRQLGVMFSTEFINGSDFLEEGDGWQISPDGTITVTNATTGVGIFYLDFPQEFTNSNLPFYQRHSVTIIVIALAAAIIIVGLVLKLNSLKNRQTEGNK
jgi:hypothetical protein